MLKIEHFDGSVVGMKYLYRDACRKIVMLHHSMGVLMEYFRLRPDDKDTFFIVNFAWFVGKEHALELADDLRRLAGFKPDALDRILFLSNSSAEADIMALYCPQARNIVANNCFTLSECFFQMQHREPIYDFAYIARPLEYKKHRYIPKLENSILVTNYSPEILADKEFVDLGALTPGKIVSDIGADAVSEILSQSCCGLILSPIEGACYASAEYLLCGIPVVSTASLGGRDEYYDERNASIVPLDTDAIRDAVEKYRADMTAGRIDRAAIREAFLDRQTFFRRALAVEVGEMTGMDADAFYAFLFNAIQWDSKLWSSIIYWAKGLTDGAQAAVAVD